MSEQREGDALFLRRLDVRQLEDPEIRKALIEKIDLGSLTFAELELVTNRGVRQALEEMLRARVRIGRTEEPPKGGGHTKHISHQKSGAAEGPIAGSPL